MDTDFFKNLKLFCIYQNFQNEKINQNQNQIENTENDDHEIVPIFSVVSRYFEEKYSFHKTKEIIIQQFDSDLSQWKNQNQKKIFGFVVTSPQEIEFVKNKTDFIYIQQQYSRQSDVLKSAVESGLPLIVEKGLFLSPVDIQRLSSKLNGSAFALVECGSPFGYDDVVCDPRSLFFMKQNAKYFGLNLTSLLGTKKSHYENYPKWLQEHSFSDPIVQMGVELGCHFFVFSEESAGPQISPVQKINSVEKKPFPNWDGEISLGVKLTTTQQVVIAGPCMLESLELGLKTGKYLKEICDKNNVPYIFKSSYDKANRTSQGAQRGPGLKIGLEWLQKIRQELNCPILTDIHTPEEAIECGKYVDILQIPAFLFEDKELLAAAASTGKVVQIKKGQWAYAQQMIDIAEYLHRLNCYKIILVERGTLFGYNNLVVDFRNLVDMKRNQHAVIFDATHAVQLPGAGDGKSSGLRHMVEPLAAAALAIGVNGIFMEVHPEPEKAWSDSESQIHFQTARNIIEKMSQNK